MAEQLQTANRCFGHRLMMDRIVPGGVTVDLTTEAIAAIRDLLIDGGKLVVHDEILKLSLDGSIDDRQRGSQERSLPRKIHPRQIAQRRNEPANRWDLFRSGIHVRAPLHQEIDDLRTAGFGGPHQRRLPHAGFGGVHAGAAVEQ